LVNNAGGINNQDLSRKKGFEKQTIDDWAKVLKLNLTGVFLCCQAVGKQMVKQKKGSIINVSSIYGLVAPDFRIYSQKTAGRGLGTPAAYSAAKAGVIGLTKYLASYYGDKNVRVNCVTPGGIYDNQDKQFVKKYTLRVPLGRMAEKDEVTGAIIYLASDLASYVTGENIIVDGGLTVW
jgi:NAD(P)-dependent dehydrogenase (short-subunit alcohol dehydrogenase family)